MEDLHLFIDECLSQKLVPLLQAHHIKVEHIEDHLGIGTHGKKPGIQDGEVIEYAKYRRYIVVTCDHGGHFLQNLAGPSQPGLVWIKTAGMPRMEKLQAIQIGINFIIQHQLTMPVVIEVNSYQNDQQEWYHVAQII